jgi:hypothetical protein
MMRIRDGQLRLRSARSTELAPLLERSRSGAIRKNGGAGVESERVFFTQSRAGAERPVNKMELEWSRSDFFPLISSVRLFFDSLFCE